MHLDNYKSIYFIGIGGIGMSALAHYFVNLGAKVSGYDRNKTELTKGLEKIGVEISYDENIDYLNDLENIQLAIFTPAINSKNIYFKYFKKSQVPLLKRSQILGEVTKSLDTIAVAGTHGKTTTTSLVTSIFQKTKMDPTIINGGVINSIKNNCTKSNVKFLLSISSDDTRSNTGANLRKILLETGIKVIPGKTSHFELNEYTVYKIPTGEEWRFPFLCSLLKIRDDELEVQFNDEEQILDDIDITHMIEDICTS